MKTGGNPLGKKHEDSPSHMKHEIPIIFDDQRVFPVFRRARPPREERVQWLRLKLNLFESEGKNLENILICPYHTLSTWTFLDFLFFFFYWDFLVPKHAHSTIPHQPPWQGRHVGWSFHRLGLSRPSTSWRLWQTNAMLRHRRWDV